MKTPSREQVERALADRLLGSLTAHQPAHVPGLGTFNVVHQTSLRQHTANGNVLLTPPRDEIVFTSDTASGIGDAAKLPPSLQDKAVSTPDRFEALDIEAGLGEELAGGTDLVEALTDRLAMNPGQIVPALGEYIEDLHRSIAGSGRVLLPEVGSFSDVGGHLSFEPDPGLAETINARFAGLRAIPFTPAKNRPATLPVRSDHIATPSPHPDRFTTPPAYPPVHRRRRRRTQSQGSVWAAAAVIIVMVTIMTYLFILDPVADLAQPETFLPVDTTEESPAFVRANSPSTPTKDADELVAIASPSSEDAATDSDTAGARDPRIAETASPPPSPLRGDQPIDLAQGGYTIVVASPTDQANAQANARRYRERGFRTHVFPARRNGEIRYRVGVGHFESIEAAVRVRDELSGRELPADSWIVRF